MLSFKNYNIADWFSFYRVAASPFLLLLIILGEREAFSWLLLISYCTDMIDGFLARRLKITSARGSQLDSLGDQLVDVDEGHSAVVSEAFADGFERPARHSDVDVGSAGFSCQHHGGG